jgi:hypothetical protein
VARKFVLKAGKTHASIPGVGVVHPGHILEGDQYARYVPGILEELPANTPVATKMEAPPAPAPKKAAKKKASKTKATKVKAAKKKKVAQKK